MDRLPNPIVQQCIIHMEPRRKPSVAARLEIKIHHRPERLTQAQHHVRGGRDNRQIDIQDPRLPTRAETEGAFEVVRVAANEIFQRSIEGVRHCASARAGWDSRRRSSSGEPWREFPGLSPAPGGSRGEASAEKWRSRGELAGNSLPARTAELKD